MNSGIFILVLSQNFQLSGCEMTSAHFKTKSETYGKSKKKKDIKCKILTKQQVTDASLSVRPM